MASVDERVVSMHFDNKNFEKGARESISTLDKLKNALQLKNGTRGLEDIDKAAQNHKLGKIGEALDSIKEKFSVTSIFAITALANIANKAVNVGMQMTKALTIDPIRMGFQEYETQMNAVQTILANTASKGTNLEQVNAVLDDLNHYADMTIYNFTEMTRNIGTFTAAGVDLETSAKAIKGIANLAAVSGSNSQQASVAMYQLSQALASGTVKLQDWNSVVNAGMGGQVFQDALKETARVHGIAIDDIIKKQGSFRESLQEGWLSSEILTETLEKFTGDLDEATLKQKGYTDAQIAEIMQLGKTANDAATKVKTFTQLIDTLKEAAQSGWTQSWEIIIGDFEEAKELWTSISDEVSGILNSTADARNKMLQEWKDLGGRDALLEGLKQGWIAIKTVLGEVGKAFREVFPATTGKQLADLTKKFSEFMTKGVAKLTESGTLDKISRTFKGLFSILKIGVTIIQAVVKTFASLVGAVLPVGGDFLSVTASVGDFFTRLNDGIQKSQGIEKFFNGIRTAISSLASLVKGVTGVIGGLFDSLSNSDADSTAITGFSKGVETAGNIMERAGELIKTGIDKIINGIRALRANLTGPSISKEGVIGDVSQLAGGGMLAALTVLIVRLSKAIKGFSLAELFDAFKNSSGFVDGIKNVLGETSKALETFTASVKADMLKKIAISIGILAASLWVLSTIKPDKLTSSIGTLSVLFVELGVAMNSFTKVFNKGTIKGTLSASAMMTALSTAILTLAVALKLLSTIDTKQMEVALGGLTATMLVMVLAMKSLNKLDGDKGVSGVVALASSLLLLSTALKLLSTIGFKEMGIALMGLAGSMTLLVGALAVISKLDLEKRIPGLIGLGTALLLLATAMKVIASIDPQNMAQAMIGLSGAMANLVGAMFILDKVDVGASAVGLLAAASALVIMGGALKIMGSMSMGEVATGLVAMAGAMGILGVALYAMQGTVSGSAALLVAAAAIGMLVPAIALLGNLDTGTVIKGIVALAAALAVVAATGALLNAVVPGLTAFAAVMAAIGVAALGISLALTALGVALTAISVSGYAAIQVLIKGFQDLMLLAPQIGVALAQIFVNFANEMAAAAPELIASFTALIQSLLDAVVTLSPQIMETLSVLITDMLNLLVTKIPEFVTAGINILVGFLNGIASNIGRVITSATNVVISFINGVAQNAPRIIDSGMKALVDFLHGLADGIRNNSGEIMEAGFDVVSAMVEGFADGVGKLAGAIWDAAKGIAQKAWDSICDFFDIFSPSKKMKEVGKYVDQGFAIGLEDNAGVVVDSMQTMAQKAFGVLSEYDKELEDYFADMDVDPVITPVLDLSEVNLATAQLNSMLNTTRGVSLAASIDKLQNFDESIPETHSSPNSITFNQYNNSPRALDRIEIYRQTRTQLASLQRI